MEHLDAELLSLLALGEPAGTDADADHLANCAQCSESLQALQYTVHIATLDPAGIELEEPGGQNWTAIHEALGLSPAVAADPLTRGTMRPATSSDTAAAKPAAGEGTTKQADGPDHVPTPLRPGRKDRHARPGLWVAAAAAGIALGAAVGWAGAGFLGQTGTPAPVPSQSVPASIVLAQTPLTPLPTHTGSGEAQVQQLPDGTRQLAIRLSNDHVSGFQGVWMGSADLTKMVSLGVLSNESGVFTLPSGIDLAQYPIVDISDQPYNGNPAHSADSIARGTLNPGN
ncbi:anti-sigma factor [Arthrobacter sp. PM3]|uniref:anti-sigma factor n=1 Tax=Arthrobacter sp. PM3 TaxID=2017685 RepID=UPI000E1064D3|nr:anti-sigma factor [Arthrobacter sp. PM3]AXJ09501.1 hypothetical protein CFN17_07675 [Arthrobacter sp. PM3]